LLIDISVVLEGL